MIKDDYYVFLSVLRIAPPPHSSFNLCPCQTIVGLKNVSITIAMSIKSMRTKMNKNSIQPNATGPFCKEHTYIYIYSIYKIYKRGLENFEMHV